MVLTKAAVISYAIACGHVDPDVAAMMAVTAWKESHFETNAISPPNRDGTRDFGPYQINANNLAPLGLTEQTALDPCEASRAAATWFKILSKYNTGNERDGILNGYAPDTYAHRHDSAPPSGELHVAEISAVHQLDPCAPIPRFDAWAREDCKHQHERGE